MGYLTHSAVCEPVNADRRSCCSTSNRVDQTAKPPFRWAGGFICPELCRTSCRRPYTMPNHRSRAPRTRPVSVSAPPPLPSESKTLLTSTVSAVWSSYDLHVTGVESTNSVLYQQTRSALTELQKSRRHLNAIKALLIIELMCCGIIGGPKQNLQHKKSQKTQ